MGRKLCGVRFDESDIEVIRAYARQESARLNRDITWASLVRDAAKRLAADLRGRVLASECTTGTSCKLVSVASSHPAHSGPSEGE